MHSKSTSIWGVALDHTLGNILRMLAVIRLPKEERGRISWGYVGTLIIILIYGLIMMFSASYSSGYTNYGDIYHFIRPQVIVALIGLAVMFLVSCINYRALRYGYESFYAITLALLGLALFMPSDNNGCFRWVYLPGGMSLQPSELAKFAVILGTAHSMDKHKSQLKTVRKGVLPEIGILVPILILLRLEPHNSAMLLMVAIVGTMMLCGGAGGNWLFALVPAGGAAGLFFLNYLKNNGGYASERLGGVWGLTPTDTAGMLWQTRQSIYAISTGGLFGVGIGNSVQKHQWLPYAENDFIFSVVCEELGFVGALALIFLFGALIVQGIYIALNAPDFFGTMLGVGIMAQVACQMFCHIGVATALLPNTGISLPFFSYGGTSLLLLMAEMGVMLSISRAGNGRAEARRRRAQEELNAQMGRTTYRRRKPL